MMKKIINTGFLIFIFIFIFLIFKYYFSEKHMIFTNKSRANYLANLNDKNNLPLLKNDTNNIIVYIDDLDMFKKKRKKRFWEKLISN